MGFRDAMAGAIEAMFEFGRVVGSSIGSSAQSVLVNIAGSGSEQRDGQAFWGHAAILARPAAPTTSPSGQVEVLFLRRGEDLIPVASRDLRWQIDLDEGDVVVRNLDGTNPVRLHLLADGTAVLEANEVKIGDAGATEAIALGTTLKSHLDALKTYVDNIATAYAAHNHPTAPVGPVSPPNTPIAGSNPSVPDIESRHKVEN